MVKKQINVVSLSDIKPVEEDTQEEIKNENDELNKIREAIKEETTGQGPVIKAERSSAETTLQVDNDTIIPAEEVKPKPKRKPATKKTKVVEDAPVVEPITDAVIEPAVEAVIEPVVEAPKKVKTLELVKCPKCGKEMTKRTLRYDHDKTCKGNPVEREKIPVKKRVKKESPAPAQAITIPEHVIEEEVKKRIQNTIQDRMQQKLKLKEERIKKLAEKIA